MLKANLLLPLAISLITSGYCGGSDGNGVHILDKKGDKVTVPEGLYEELHIFCHKGVDTSLAKFWSSVDLRLRIESDNYNVYLAPNVTAVMEMHEQQSSSWFYSGLPYKPKNLKLNPFETSCVGVLTRDAYNVVLQIWNVNFWQVGMTIAGLLLFIYAPTLCASIFFHYTTGILVGLCFSLIVLTYILQRRMNFWLSFWMIFYSLSLYAITTAWMNLKSYLMEHHIYVFGYVVIVGLVSFAITYRLGPIENKRTLNLIQWAIQLFSLILIFLSSYHQTASLSIALAVVGWASIPDTLKTRVQVQYKRRFCKPKIKLLSEGEYLDQSRVETEKALQELRKFCQSPNCNPWRLTSRLNTPTRFAEFVQGSSHLTQDEVMQYSQVDFDDDDDEDSSQGDASNNRASITDDDSSDEIDLENELEGSD